MKTLEEKHAQNAFENEIYNSYCRGENRRDIKHKFKISDVQFVKIIFNKIKKENKRLAAELLMEEPATKGEKEKIKKRDQVQKIRVLKFIHERVEK